ncbi:hypothetical protein [Curtobacterium aetherium]|uniref:Uncharacterized protein n=1 Tax=Curtobacterium aetherium TaxID=2841594 RepID=A0ACD1E0U5_9MICO|nr:hypothetical protein [Curtobacterium sp. L6-1]QWS32562.1 hypothetical protein KM842_09690 [Curtobacterium sp. L6-1]
MRIHRSGSTVPVRSSTPTLASIALSRILTDPVDVAPSPTEERQPDGVASFVR